MLRCCVLFCSANGQSNEVRFGKYAADAEKDTEGITGGFPYKCTVIEGACTVDCGSHKKIICDTESFVPDAIPALASSSWCSRGYQVTDAHHCGGASILAWPDGKTANYKQPLSSVVKPRSNEYGQPEWSAADPIAECKRVCDAHRDVCEAFVLNKNTAVCTYWKTSIPETPNANPDFVCYRAEKDSDGDGVGDFLDAFPLDPLEHTDTDNDNMGNNLDLDDDGDGIADIVDPYPMDGNGDDLPDSPIAEACFPSIEDDGSGILDVQVIIERGTGQKEEYFLLDGYTYANTRHSSEIPTLLGITPRHTTSHQTLSIVGSSFGTSIKLYRVVYVGTGPPPNGANIQTEANSTKEGASHAICRPQGLNRAVFFEGMDHAKPTAAVMPEDAEPLPIWKDYFRCQVGDFAAGSYNVSVHVDKGRAWSNADVQVGLFEKNSRGLLHQVQYFPTVTYMSLHQGSTAGGAAVEILGSGFDEHLEHNSVLIQGLPCIVTSASLERIACTAPAEISPPVPPALDPVTSLPDADTPQLSVVVDDADCDERPGMLPRTDPAAFGGSFTADNGMNKGKSWIRYKPTIVQTNFYEVFLEIPGADPANPAACLPRAANVSVVIQHSGSNHVSSVSTVLIESMDLGDEATSLSLGEYLFVASEMAGTASVTVDNTGSSGCVVADRVKLEPRTWSGGALPSCTDKLAQNYGSINDAECLYLGGRGIIQQSWGVISPALRDQHTLQNPTSWAMRPTTSESECPWPGSEDGWSTRDGQLLVDSVDTACTSDTNCPSHKVCPASSFCCLDIGHEGCRPALQMPAGGSYVTGCTDLQGWTDKEGQSCAVYLKTGTCMNGLFSSGKQSTLVCLNADRDGIDASHACCACGGGVDHGSAEGWKLVFRQRLPKTNASDVSKCNYEADRGFFAGGEFRKYPDYPKGSLYSILDEIEASRGEDGLFDFRLTYPGTTVDVQWKQGINPTWANSATLESVLQLNKTYAGQYCPTEFPRGNILSLQYPFGCTSAQTCHSLGLATGHGSDQVCGVTDLTPQKSAQELSAASLFAASKSPIAITEGASCQAGLEGAAATCAAAGARLCTLDELQASETEPSGLPTGPFNSGETSGSLERARTAGVLKDRSLYFKGIGCPDPRSKKYAGVFWQSRRRRQHRPADDKATQRATAVWSSTPCEGGFQSYTSTFWERQEIDSGDFKRPYTSGVSQSTSCRSDLSEKLAVQCCADVEAKTSCGTSHWCNNGPFGSAGFRGLSTRLSDSDGALLVAELSDATATTPRTAFMLGLQEDAATSQRFLDTARDWIPCTLVAPLEDMMAVGATSGEPCIIAALRSCTLACACV
jgi:hypothetical protein